MFDPRLIDVAIGIILLFLLVSLLVTIVQEAIASFLKLRAANLRAAIDNLLGSARATELYAHPLIASLYKSGSEVAAGRLAWLKAKWHRPSYIPDRTFVLALLDVLRRQTTTEGAAKEAELKTSDARPLLEDVRALVEGMPRRDEHDERLRRVLSLLVNNLPADVTGRGTSAALEQWFNDAMDRASGWYKRQAQALSIGIGFCVAVFANGDALHVASRLWSDASLRASVTAAAVAYQHDHAGSASAGAGADPGAPAVGEVPGPPASSMGKRLDDDLSALESSTLPVGWMRDAQRDCTAQFCDGNPPGVSLSTLLLMLAGWLVTALATSLGAPFWFDLLSKALQIRSTGGRVATDGDPKNKR